MIYEPTQVNGQLHVRCSVGQMERERYSKTSGRAGIIRSARLMRLSGPRPQQMILKVCLMGGRPPHPPAGDISSNFWEQQTGAPVESLSFLLLLMLIYSARLKGVQEESEVKRQIRAPSFRPILANMCSSPGLFSIMGCCCVCVCVCVVGGLKMDSLV